MVDALIAAGDSLYWLRADSTGLRLRGVAMTIAQLDGRFHEIYSVEDDHSFYDAVFVGQGVYRRDLQGPDSMLVVRDTLIPRLAAAYAAANPRERQLRPDEPANEYARTVATVMFEDFDVFGPFLSYDHVVEVDVVGGSTVRTMRRVIADMRTGEGASLDGLFGKGTAAQMLATAQEDLAASADPTAWRVEASSFRLGGTADTVIVTFEAVAIDSELGTETLSLTPIAVPAPEWWRALRGERPLTVEPVTRYVSADLELSAAALADDGRTTITLRDAASRLWEAGKVTGEVRRVYWLDSTVTPGTRDALSRAFDDAVLYSGEARIVRGPSVRRPSSPFRFASFPSPSRSRR
jgi:hypothetical protein